MTKSFKFLYIIGKFIPASQRPDGTWRKARRVKDGYIPQEEVPLYESKGKLFAKKPDIPVGMCPLYAKEARDRRQRDQESSQSSSKSGTVGQNRIPGIINTKPHNSSNLLATTASKNKQKQQNKSGTNQQNTIMVKPSSSSSTSTTDKISENLNNLTLDPETELAKKLKKLKKKIREIEAIEAKLNSGELKNPEKDQLEKVARKREYLNQIERLEKPK